ncbi:hypothetical protein GCM10010363_60300 [Streptomyces omiyaensis]|uniref:hypothetical protein n=1 Tax=Streptomyces omiyaensis TaxID=68247 RepID=UPI00167AA6AA|nr:hypothetical protein [Streptomyces omiyaensis]GGY71099.1 hypothetical protein GCM10010363_60300 [Streptomyces omiyaensis]
MTSTTLAYRLGETDTECRYPVIIGKDQMIGRVFRWHRNWFAVDNRGETNLGRPAVGAKGVDMAAGFLATAYANGEITATPYTPATDAELSGFTGPVPLLHPRMPQTARNEASAHKALLQLAAYRWSPLGGFPGSDNLWLLRCDLESCGWIGAKHYSHLRGRNGNPPSAHRHPGCIGEDKVRALIPAYQK